MAARISRRPREITRAPADLTIAEHELPGIKWRPNRWQSRLLVALVVVAVLAGATWYIKTPTPLPLDRRTVTATGTSGQDLYIGMFAAGRDFGRTIRVRGVKVQATSSAPITITPLLCRRGTVGVSTKPDEFCADILDPEGQRLVAGDSIILKVRAKEGAIAVVKRVDISYREDLRGGTKPAGYAKAIVTITGPS